MSIINKDNVSKFAFSNAQKLKCAPRGIVLSFHGLGGQDFPLEPDKLYDSCTKAGVLAVYPYDCPWSWMNDTSVRIVDEIIDAFINKYSLANNIPVVSSGGSMGGLSSLMFSLYSKHTPVACAASCPVCDLVYHYGERDDLPRTIYSAFAHYPLGLEESMAQNSPMHQTDNMPRIPYLIVICTADTAVEPDNHGTPYVEKMKAAGYNVRVLVLPGREHCCLTDEAVSKYNDFCLSNIKRM